MKKKFKLEDYKGKNYALHCPEKWQAEAFCEFMCDAGKTWDGTRYLKGLPVNSNWERYKNGTCYAFNSGFAFDISERNSNYQILEFSDFDWEDIEELYTVNSFLKRETAQPKNDPVNHPSHYTDGKIEVIDFIEDKKLGFARGNAVKYICRAGKKNPDKEIEDLEKAIWYIQREIKMLGGAE